MSHYKPTVLIRNWQIIDLWGKKRLHGDVVDHPKLGTRSGIYTSSIQSQDISKGLVETRNTIYRLEERPD